MNRMLPLLECQKTDFNCPITSKNGDLTVNELPSAQISSFTLISKALFTENRRKKKKKTDRKPFVSLGCDCLNGNKGPECSAIFRRESRTIELVFVLPQKVSGGQERRRRRSERRGCQWRGLHIVREPQVFASVIAVTK